MNPYIPSILKLMANPLIQANMMMSTEQINRLAKDDSDLAGWISDLCQTCNELMKLLESDLGSEGSVLVGAGSQSVN
jgi:hypothetical protein